MDDQLIFELDSKELKETYLKALKHDVQSMYVIAMLLKEKHRPAEAVVWLKKAANEQYEVAQYELANCYYAGDGIAEDEKKAFELYEVPVYETK